MSGTVSIKEFLELKIAYEAAEIKHVKEIMVEREIALKIQAKEYERRLEGLNGEAERLRVMQATYMPRELSEQKHKDHINSIKVLTDWKNKQEGMQSRSQLVSILALIISIIFGLYKILN